MSNLSSEMNEADKPYQVKSMSWAQRPVTGPAVTGPAQQAFNLSA